MNKNLLAKKKEKKETCKHINMRPTHKYIIHRYVSVLCLHVCLVQCDVGAQGTGRMGSLFSMLRIGQNLEVVLFI